MKILAVDTTSSYPSLALIDDDQVLLEYNFVSTDNLSAILMPNLEFVLRSAGLTLDQVELFAVAVGPGNFTGIRVGLATIKGILFAQPRPVVALNTLETLAFKAAPSSRTIIPLIDARRGEVYCACYRVLSASVQETAAPELLPVVELPRIVTSPAEVLFVGSGLDYYRDYLKEAFPEAKMRFRSSFLASEIGRLAWIRYGEKQYLNDLQDLLPFYLRRPDAEQSQLD